MLAFFILLYVKTLLQEFENSLLIFEPFLE